ncbi:hypothetical protein [Sphaerisporangium flaviroseum]
MTPDMQWRLLVPFTAPQLRFTEELSKTVAGYGVTIRPGSFPLGEIIVCNLPSEDAVRHAFLTLKRGMLIASINVPCGIRIEDDLMILDDNSALPSRKEQPFACPQSRSLERIILKPGPIEYQMSFALPKLMQGIQLGATSKAVAQALSDQRIALACTLYIDSFFETSYEAQFITLIGVLEVLKERGPVSPDAMQLIDGWLEEIRHLEVGEAQSFRGRLNFLKQISLGAGIRRTVTRYLGSDRAREVQELYNIRSKLVHEGERPLELRDNLRQAEIIVRELLAKILVDPRNLSEGRDI